MSEGKRHHMRIALSDADYAAFKEKKAAAEKTVGVVMSEPQFALSLIRWAVRQDND
jgi:hypothetical protein